MVPSWGIMTYLQFTCSGDDAAWRGGPSKLCLVGKLGPLRLDIQSCCETSFYIKTV